MTNLWKVRKQGEQPETVHCQLSPATNCLYQPPHRGKGTINMSSRREQLIDLLVNRTTVSRERLQRSSTDELEEALSKSLLAGIRREVENSPEIVERQRQIDEINADRQRMAQEQQLSNIFRTPVTVNGKPAIAIDNQGNRSIIAGWLQEDQGEHITPAWFKKVLSEQPQLVSSLSWQSADILDPAKLRQAEATQAAEERRVFHDFCRDNGFSECESNHLLAKSVLEGGFDKYTLAQAVQSNALSLAPASPEELAKFRQEAITLHNQYLSSLDVPTLRKLAREAGARGQAAPQLDETQRVRQAERQDRTAYPILPEEFRDGSGPEEVLDAKFIRKCSKETLKFLFKRFGSAQVEEALRTRRSDASPLW
jgi:hypothetical protein